MILLALLAQATEPAAAAEPLAALRGQVVEAIRNCPKGEGGEITVCARDRGFAEKYRIQKLDPRFAEHEPAANVDVLAGGVPGGGDCSRVGGSGAGCALRDYRAWGAWKEAEKASGRWFPW